MIATYYLFIILSLLFIKARSIHSFYYILLKDRIPRLYCQNETEKSLYSRSLNKVLCIWYKISVNFTYRLRQKNTDRLWVGHFPNFGFVSEKSPKTTF
jgi:hypothetical protein